jgi:2-alkyl-3-oxoalkanoate reductase
MTKEEPRRPLRVFVAGGSGAIGKRLLPKLAAKGYEVTATTRSPGKVDDLRRLGAEPVVLDAFDRTAVIEAVGSARPDVVVNQLTALPKSGLKPRKLGEYYAQNDRVRREGTDNLLAAARKAAARRYVGQSIAFWYEPTGGMIKRESDPLWFAAPTPIGEAVAALERSEDAALNADDVESIVLRYGTFYGPGTWYSPDGEIGLQMTKRQYPKVGSGEGVTSFVHIDDAADACAAFVAGGPPGVYNVVDDEPATASEWMPVFAAAVGAKAPRRVPTRLAKLIAGKALVEWTTTCRGASNEKIKRELDWHPRYASWRQGFEKALEG